jgi:hypothetical protein
VHYLKRMPGAKALSLAFLFFYPTLDPDRVKFFPNRSQIKKILLKPYKLQCNFNHPGFGNPPGHTVFKKNVHYLK